MIDNFVPNKARAQRLVMQIKNSLRNSLFEVIEFAADSSGVNEQILRSTITSLAGSLHLPPAAFLLYYDCLSLVLQDAFPELSVLLSSFMTVPMNASPLTIRNLDDSSLRSDEWDRYRRSLHSNHNTKIEIIACPVAEFNNASQILHQALHLILTTDSKLHDEISILVSEVIFAQEQSSVSMTFGGATAFRAWGAIFLNPRHYSTVISMIEGIVHEAAHMFLLSLSSGKVMVLNNPDELFLSPLRQGGRPMDGIFHATFVSARVSYAMDKLLSARTLTLEQQAEAKQRKFLAFLAFNEGFQTLEKFGQFTEIGAAALAGAHEYMLG